MAKTQMLTVFTVTLTLEMTLNKGHDTLKGPGKHLRDHQADFNHTHEAQNNALSGHLIMMSFCSTRRGVMSGIWLSGNCVKHHLNHNQ